MTFKVLLTAFLMVSMFSTLQSIGQLREPVDKDGAIIISLVTIIIIYGLWMWT